MKIKPLRDYTPWYDKPNLIFFLVLFIPVIGIYGIIRTSVISRKGKINLFLGFVLFWTIIVALCLWAASE